MTPKPLTHGTQQHTSHAALGSCPARLPQVVACDCGDTASCPLLAYVPPPESCEARRLPVLGKGR